MAVNTHKGQLGQDSVSKTKTKQSSKQDMALMLFYEYIVS
jgi:hypothetical protein